MKIYISIQVILISIFSFLYCSENEKEDIRQNELFNGKVKILQAWQGDYSVDQLQLLPGNQQENAVGYIGDEHSFSKIWNQFKPDQTSPEIDFKDNLVLFARNTQFYNRIAIGQVKLTDGVAEILAMETMSALPIENNVALSLAVVSRKGVKEIKVTDDLKIKIEF